MNNRQSLLSVEYFSTKEYNALTDWLTENNVEYDLYTFGSRYLVIKFSEEEQTAFTLKFNHKLIARNKILG